MEELKPKTMQIMTKGLAEKEMIVWLMSSTNRPKIISFEWIALLEYTQAIKLVNFTVQSSVYFALKTQKQ